MALLEFEKEFFIHTSMIGHEDVIRPAAIMDLFQDIASIHAKKIGVGFEDLFRLHYLWIVSYIEFDIKKPFKCYEDVRLKTWPDPKSRLEFLREFEMKNKAGETLVTGMSSWVVTNTETRKLCRGDDVVFDGEYLNYTNYPGFKRGKVTVDTSRPVKEWDYTILSTDLDHNGHMNNAKYPDIIYNGGETNIGVKKLKIAFLHEILVGETMHMTAYRQSDKIMGYIGTCGENKCFECEVEYE